MIRKLREPMNGFTHFIGILLAIAGLIALLTRQDSPVTIWHVVSFSIFGGAMILLYLSSTLYHWLPLREKKLELFRKIDHIMIFVFIAATYTPICLISLRGAWGWSILASVWAVTLAGAFMKLFWLHAPRWLYTGVYVLMGWIIVICIKPLSATMATGGLIWMIVGGLVYMTGAIVYALKKPNPGVNFLGFHEIFHILVMLGSFSHFWVMYRYV